MELNEMLKRDDEFRYRMLSRMKSDCNYYLGYGGRHPKHLWAGSEVEQIAYMKALWNSFDEHQKPEWLTMDQILDYEQKMGIKAILVEMDYKGYYERFALTPEEFKIEFPEAFEYFNDVLKEGNSHTVKPLVHIFFVETVVGSEKWNEFFTDMEWGLPESDIESGNLAYIDEHQFQSLAKYMQKEQRFYVYNELINTWVDELLKNTNKSSFEELSVKELSDEIEEVKGAIANERLWAKTDSVHEDNIKNLKEYLGVLEEGLSQRCNDSLDEKIRSSAASVVKASSDKNKKELER